MADRTDRLATYRHKRDAKRTPEPVPAKAPLPTGDDNTFVIQEHHARALHWDLRLERDGVLVSWAVPKGIPADPKTNHLAVHTEDHPLEYASFSGEIPRGEYGGGSMTIWDQGTYETEKWSDREVMVVLHGNRVSGKYVLFKTRGKNWMIHRMDPPADPDAEPLPDRLVPMRAVERKQLPRDQDKYGFEFAYGGRRVLAFIEYGRIRLADDSGQDVTDRHRHLTKLGESLGSRPALLDGEVARLGGTEIYLIFDLLYLDARSLLEQPYVERRSTLDDLALAGPSWQIAPWYEGDGTAVREAAAQQALPGIVAKPLAQPYEPGGDGWLYIPIARRS